MRSAAPFPEVADVLVSRFGGSAAEWDAFARRQRGWTHFHLYDWRNVIEHVFPHECVYLCARSGDQLVGVLPLVRVRSVVFGHFLVSMPFVNYGGPLGTDEGVRALAAEASRMAADDGVTFLELRSREPLPLDLGVSHRKVTFLLDLPQESDALWSALPSKLRSQIRRPKKDGVVVRFGADQMHPFYEVLSRHMRDLGTPVMPRRFFEVVAETFAKDVHFAVAYLGDKPIACGCGFLWDDEFEITWASALRTHRALSPNMLVYWELMQRVSQAGARRFNFGRCSPGSGTYRFKTQWGGRETPLWWYHCTPTAMYERTVPSQERGAFAVASRIWQRLPLPVTNFFGPSIARFIP